MAALTADTTTKIKAEGRHTTIAIKTGRRWKVSRREFRSDGEYTVLMGYVRTRPEARAYALQLADGR